MPEIVQAIQQRVGKKVLINFSPDSFREAEGYEIAVAAYLIKGGVGIFRFSLVLDEPKAKAETREAIERVLAIASSLNQPMPN